jgi:predicted small lipoprotein YifL
VDSLHLLRYKGRSVSTGCLMTLRRLVIFAVVVGLLAACGVRGALEPPPGTKKEDLKKNPDFILDGLV